MSVTLVCGFGRCGSSLLMQMLHAGGMNVLGVHPSYEDTRTTITTHNASWFADAVADNAAVKVLRPMLAPFPVDAGHVQSIWLDRDLKQQAKSRRKAWRWLAPGTQPDTAKTLIREMRMERPQQLAFLRRLGNVTTLKFEQVLVDPETVAKGLCVFTGRDLDIDAMVAKVAKRKPACLEGLMEKDMIAERDRLLA